MMKLKSKKAAIELSMTTIIIVVLSLALLILGFVLVRNIMCGAIGFSTEINEKVEGEIQKLFETSTGELSCFGGGQEAAALGQGEINYIFCEINAKEKRMYRISIESLSAPGKEIDDKEVKSWLKEDSWEEEIPAGDDTIYKIGIIKLPEDANLVPIRAKLKAEKKVGSAWETATGSKDIDFIIQKKGVVRSVLC